MTFMKRRANAKANADFVDLSTVSGHRLAILDPLGKHYHFDPSVNDETLGIALTKVLDSSRILEVAEAEVLRSGAQKYYEDWVAAVMTEHKYRSRRDMFEAMRSCRIETSSDVITIIPLNHHKLEGWNGDGMTPDDHVAVAVDSVPEKIGAALRAAFERCT